MSTLKVAGAALNQTPLDWDKNCAHILEAISLAKTKDVSLLCLPELCISGYGCEDAFYAEGTRERSIESLQKIVAATSNIAVAAGLPIFHEGELYNASCLIANKEIIGFSCKQFLANQGLHYEARWFRPWLQGKVSQIEISSKQYPLGELCYVLGDAKIGFEICEDAWVLNRPGIKLAENDVDIILNPSASHFAFRKFEIRKKLVLEGSRSFNCAYIYANHLGNESGRAIYDGGTLIANTGQLIAAGPRLSFQDIVVTEAIVDLELGRIARSGSAQALEKTAVKETDYIKRCTVTWIPQSSSESKASTQVSQAAWESGQKIKEEEFTRAVALGLFDYMRKSYSNGFVISLSGGADSSAIACLVYYALKLALNELGSKGLSEKLSYVPKEISNFDLKNLVAEFLTTVYQASENSGDVTKSAAATVAAAVGASHHELNVAGIISEYTKLVESSLGKNLNWNENDLVLQNIQARARGPSVWMFANIKGALLLATSNRSEVAVGYATMDGDTCGSISPIAGIDKAFLRQWLLWVEKEGPQGLCSIPAVSAVNNQEPTAELRPTAQTDEADLMPYVALEFIERAAIRDKKAPKDILLMLKTQFPDTVKAEHLRWVKLFFTLWSKSQWKRERYAPSFHLDDESLDPKTWCRFPILSGGYKKELSELS